MIVDELVMALGFDLRGEDDAKRFKRQVDSLSEHANRATATLSRIGVAAAGAFAAFAASAGALNVVGSINDTNAHFETLQIRLDSVFGSMEAGKEAFAWVSEFARVTPYDLDQVTEALAKLQAMGVDGRENDLLRDIGDTASAMGKPIDQAVEAYTDALMGENERLKEFGVNAITEGEDVTLSWIQNGERITRHTKRNTAEHRKFLQEAFQRFGGAMDRMSRSYTGIISNISDEWQRFLSLIGEAGYWSSLKSRLEGVLRVLDRWSNDGTMQRIAQRISDILVGAMDIAQAFGSALWRVADNAYAVAQAVASALREVGKTISTMTGGAISPEWGAILGLGALLAVDRRIRGVLIGLSRWVARRSPWVAGFLIADDFVTALRGGDAWINQFEGVRERIETIHAEVAKLQAAGGELQDAFGNLFGSIFGADAAEWFKNLSLDDVIGNVVRFVLDEIRTFVGELQAQAQAVSAFVNDLADSINRLADAWARINPNVETVKNLDGSTTSFVEGADGTERPVITLSRLGVAEEQAPTVTPPPSATPDAQAYLDDLRAREAAKIEGRRSPPLVASVKTTIAPQLVAPSPAPAGLFSPQPAADLSGFRATLDNVAQGFASAADRMNAAVAAAVSSVPVVGAQNFAANAGKMQASAVTEQITNDNRQDNRDQSTHVSAPVSITVNEAAAPMATARAVGAAVGQAAAASAAGVSQATRIELEPTTP